MSLLPDEAQKVLELVKTFQGAEVQASQSLSESQSATAAANGQASPPSEAPAKKRGRPPKSAESEQPESEAVSLDDLKPIVVKAFSADKAGVEAVLKKYGAAKASEVKPEDRAKLKADLEELLAAPI